MRVLVIGGSGFIGPSIVTELLRSGHQVAVLHRGQATPQLRPEVKRIIGDRRQLDACAADLRAFAPEVVIDVILSSGTQARQLVDLIRGTARRIVALSSMDVYRACGVVHRLEPGGLEPLPLTESSRLRTVLNTYPPAQVKMLSQVFGWLDDEYDKIPVEQAILAAPDLESVVLRLPMVYGPGDPLHRFHPIVKRIADDRPTILFSRDLAAWRATKGYVAEVGAAVALAATSPAAAGVYNVGEPDTLSELEWAEAIARAAGWTGSFTLLPDDRVPPHLRSPGNAAQHWVADTSRIRDQLGYRESLPRADAIAHTVAWQRSHPPTGFTPHQFDYPAEDAALRPG